MVESNLYPTISIELIQNPNRLFAFPIFGGLVKLIMLIPVGLWSLALAIALGVVILINSFVVLFTGKYWQTAYNLNLGIMRYTTKMYFFWFGLTNKYPGFSLNIDDNYTLDIACPENPSKLFAIPLIGFLVRIVLLIPFSIFQNIIGTAATIGVNTVGWILVLFTGKYPESIFELTRDQIRLSLAMGAYISGLSDKYPSFSISMNHRTKKIILIIIGLLAVLSNIISSLSQSSKVQ